MLYCEIKWHYLHMMVTEGSTGLVCSLKILQKLTENVYDVN